MYKEERPWGFFEILSYASDQNTNKHQVKRLVIRPGQKISLQRHQHRAEHWFIVEGNGIATVGESYITVEPGDSVDIPVRTVHRIHCTSKTSLILIEVQTGTYLGEDDIERIEDMYHRS